MFEIAVITFWLFAVYILWMISQSLKGIDAGIQQIERSLRKQAQLESLQ